MCAAATVLLAGCGGSGQPPVPDDPDVIRIGLLSALSGPHAALGEAANRGAKLALLEAGGTLVGNGPLDAVRGARVAGKPVQLFVESSDPASPDVAVSAARRLVELRGADVIVGPMWGDEGLALKNYIAGVPDVTLVNGMSAVQNMTLRDPEPNVFRFSTDGAQWTAGLGEYAAARYDRIVTVAEDDAYPYDQVGGFLTEFCGPQRSVVKRLWIPRGTTDFAAYVDQVPADADAVFLALDGKDAVGFLRELDAHTDGANLPVLAGSLTLDAAALDELGDRLEDAVTAGPVAALPTARPYRDYAESMREHFPDAPAPGVADVLYYVAMKATLAAVEEADGDVTGEQRAFRAALSSLAMDTPQGPVRLDANRQVIANNYLLQVRDGKLALLREVPAVTQSLGRDPVEYAAQPAFDRSNPVCRTTAAAARTTTPEEPR
ncbi:MAG: ABC transporter substrate-binding protein [Pseudonocardia sp.]